MEKKICFENITEKEFLDFFDLSEMPELFQEINIPGTNMAKNITMDGDGIIAGTVFAVIIEIVKGISISVCANFLYEKMKNLSKKEKVKIKIDDQEIKELTEIEIEKRLNNEE